MCTQCCAHLRVAHTLDSLTHSTSHQTPLLPLTFYDPTRLWTRYIGLFYLGFYENDMLKLRHELTMVFTVDTFRRITCECLIPMALKFVERRFDDRARKLAAKKKVNELN